MTTANNRFSAPTRASTLAGLASDSFDATNDRMGADIEACDALDRRRFLQSAAAASLLVSGGAATAQSAASLEGYAQSPSVHAGQSLAFSVRDPAAGAGTSTATYRIVRLAGWVDLTMQQGSVTLRNHAVPADASSNGCRWPAALSLPIPIGWPSGIYYAHFAGAAGSWCSVPFVVRPPVGAAAQRVLVVVPVSTAQAKNNYGGGSLYDFSSAGGRRFGRVSFSRPFAERWNYGFDAWQPLLARWLNRRGILADFCTDLDLHDDPNTLNGTTLMVVAGHHAYWTREGRKTFDTRVASGLNVALFSGQNMCWQSRLEATATGRVLVCYKNAAADPDTRAAYKTVRWAELTPGEPENASTGLGSAGAATWTGGAVRPATRFTSHTPEHWVFKGVELEGDPRSGWVREFGSDLVGPYTDRAGGAGIEGPADVGTRLFSTTAFGAPLGATILASAYLGNWQALGAQRFEPVDRRWSAEMVIFSRNGGAGTVFNAGTSDWVRGLAPELAGQAASAAGRITANVMARLSTGNHVESADVRAWWTFDEDTRPSGNTTEPLNPLIRLAVEPLQLQGTITAFRAFVGPVPGAVPIYRYRAAQHTDPSGFRYLLSMRADHANGWTPNGIAFYAYPNQIPGTKPIYRHHIVQAKTVAEGWRLFYFGAERLGYPGWSYDEVAFFVPQI